jgi:flagellar hook-associated protein 3 FlgL
MTTIATFAQHIRLQNQMQRMRSDLNRLTKEIGSGTHADYFAGLGSQATRAMALRTAFSQIGFYKESANVAKTHLDGQQRSLSVVKTVAIEVRDRILSVQNGADNNAWRTIQEGAHNQLDQVRAAVNQAVGGRFVFAGPAVNQVPLPDDAGLSVLDTIKASHDLSTEDGMQAFLDEVHSVFEGTHPDPTWTFEQVFYGGSTSGQMTSVIDAGSEVSLDVRANDPALKTVLEALYVLDTVPASESSIESYRLLAQTMTTRLSDGIGQTVDLSAAVGYRQELVKQTLDRHDQTMALANNTVAGLESIDEYEAANRLTALQTQMEMTYTVTARLNRLSFVNFL